MLALVLSRGGVVNRFAVMHLCQIGSFCDLCCRYAKEVCDAIAAKCLTGRPKTVEKSQTIFLLWVELEATEVFLVSSVTMDSDGGIQYQLI